MPAEDGDLLMSDLFGIGEVLDGPHTGKYVVVNRLTGYQLAETGATEPTVYDTVEEATQKIVDVCTSLSTSIRNLHNKDREGSFDDNRDDD